MRKTTCVFSLCLVFLSVSAAAQTFTGVDPSTVSDGAKSSSDSPGACTVRVTADEVVVSDSQRTSVGYHVTPSGVIPNPSAWPYFAWSDTPLGVVRSRDGSGYLFFGSDGGCHLGCWGSDGRSGSITLSQGTLDHPLGQPSDDPNPPPNEFAFPYTNNLPTGIDYVGGGPVYRVPEGEPGSGNLLIVYHAERPANPFWSWLGLAKSTDDGLTWQDLGLIISDSTFYDPNGGFDIGDGNLIVAWDAATSEKYFYIYFGTASTYLSVARASYSDLLRAAFTDSGSSTTPASTLFHKYYEGKWEQPGLRGKAAELFPAVTGETDGDPQIAWSAYRNRFVAIMDNGQYIAYGESADGLNWPAMQPILGTSPQSAVYGGANAVGRGLDPGILGDTFYSYYTAFPTGVSWQPATLNRLTITTAPTLKGVSPSTAPAGAPSLELTVTGDHFVSGSTVLWNGSPLATTFISSTQLSAAVPAAALADPGSVKITVLSPPPCGGTSDSVALEIRPSGAAPTVAISADSKEVFTGQPFTLTWSSTNANACTAKGSWSGEKPVDGRETITPRSDGLESFTLVCTGAGGVSQATASVEVQKPSVSMTEHFYPNSVTIPTSEGAPYGFCDFWVVKASSCAKQKNFGYGPTKVMQVYICLSGEVSIAVCSQQPQVTGLLSPEMLKDIDDRLNSYLGTGMRLLLRFTYNFGPIGAADAPIDVIEKHIEQVAPIVIRHNDLIFALEAGFIGTWGEWHDSTHGNDTAAAQKIVLDKERAYFNGLFPILVRTPGSLVQYTGSLVPERGLGIHDDYYASNSNDAATWSTCAPRCGFCLSGYTPEELKTYGAKVSLATMFAGEFGAVYAPLQNCAALDKYSFTYHPQSITLHPYPTTIAAELEKEGCAPAFYNKVGTRIVLEDLNVIGDAKPGGRVYLAASMINDGYGRVIRERPAYVILLQAGREVARIAIPREKFDLRALTSAAKPAAGKFQFEFALPAALDPGPLSIALLFQDPGESLRPIAAYALPLNSLDKKGQELFNPTTGYNVIASLNIEQSSR